MKKREPFERAISQIRRTNPWNRQKEDAMRAARIGAVIGILGALIAAPSVSAGGVTQTTISIHIVFRTGGADETFTTTGGLLCPAGTAVSDPFFQTIGGSQNRGNFTFHLVKTLTCDDESGT